MIDKNLLEKFPEKLVIISGADLLARRHMTTPPDLTTVIRSPQNAPLLFEILREEYPADHPLRLEGPSGEREITIADLKDNESILEAADHLIIPPLPEQYSFENFQNTVAILRGPHGCPWDKKQTHQSIRDDFLQEAYELLEGLDRGDKQMILEELGDVLFHVVLQAQMGIDNGEFTMGDVIRHVNDKIIFRHQHVFGSPEDIIPAQVTLRWEQLKQKEREKQHKKGGLLDGISRAMPALSQACSCQNRAAKAGIEWDTAEDIRDKLSEEYEEFISAETPEAQAEELGDLLFCIVSLARYYKIDPESALRMANGKFRDRVRYLEDKARESGCDIFGLGAEEKVKYWNEARAAEKHQ